MDTFAFLGFIAGPRSCIGQYFALLETKIVLGLLLKRFQFTIPASNKGTKHKSQIPLCPVDNMCLLVD
jgi:cytochrome P450